MGTRSAELLQRLEKGPPIISDGGMGAQLLLRGWQGPTADANLHARETVEELHRAFISAGAELILTNTFTACFSDAASMEALVRAGIERARAAGTVFVAGSTAVEPHASRDHVTRLAQAFESGGVDAIWIETATDRFFRTTEFARWLGYAVTIPVFVSYTPAALLEVVVENGEEQLGSASGWAETDHEFFFSARGVNCGEGPEQSLDAIRRGHVRARTEYPLTIRPSAGLPTGEGRSLQWPVRPAAFGDFAEEAQGLGARIIGGCCGASPDHIAAIADRLRSAVES